MLIDVRQPGKLAGRQAADAGTFLGAVVEAVRDALPQPEAAAHLRVVCDWVQYKENFREPVAVRRITPTALQEALAERGTDGARGPVGPGAARRTAEELRPAEHDGPVPEHGGRCEIAVDLRRGRGPGTNGALSAAIARALAPERLQDGAGRLYLEPWGRGAASCIWAFNALYWRALGLWEASSGREYEQALPGGESGARNTAAARQLIEELFAVWDDLAARRALPEELHVLELGVGNGNQARVWLDEFLRLDQARRTDYYRRLHYLMGDYSPHVLERARRNVRQHADYVSCLTMDATRPGETLGFLRHKAFLVYISNVYDNLPTDEIVRLGGHLFLVQVRAYLPAKAARELADGLGMEPAALPELIGKLLRLGPEALSDAGRFAAQFGTPMDAVAFWRRTWAALRLDERYVPLEALDAYEIAAGLTGLSGLAGLAGLAGLQGLAGLSGELLRPILEANGDVRMHASNGAVASLAETLPLLHPLGSLCCHDLFVMGVDQYLTGFRGPGKYDGSVVNWVNGPVLAAIGRRAGFDVQFTPFAHRPGANVSTLTAKVRE